eukprot:CAMPEP_0206428918 /NCGR_PEP_ID=MMETSP0324_2-20121206/5940_1 /ASSEMBLY_ACC=CAM_ASM_000836 /TAXON_ID=2866 /ORGANISM="Crypthecodinium cohnii, Strain Seligo" /LENGTH=75 /DNA_ID=CAMNT_0053894517 /DNA_START=71 /DNA_END=295 /DNA_ORIENTATION=+
MFVNFSSPGSQILSARLGVLSHAGKLQHPLPAVCLAQKVQDSWSGQPFRAVPCEVTEWAGLLNDENGASEHRGCY